MCTVTTSLVLLKARQVQGTLVHCFCPMWICLSVQKQMQIITGKYGTSSHP